MNQSIQQNPKVSVGIPSYNHSRYIERTLESIFAQTYRNIQLIVVDDGSTDNSPAIIEKILKNSPFDCELIARQNKGQGVTANECIERTSSEFHAPVASDDMWFPDFLERRVNLFLKRPNAVLAYGHCFLVDENDKIIGCSTDWETYGDKDTRKTLLKMYGPQSPTVVYRRSTLETQMFHPDNFVDDIDLYMRLSVLGEFAFDSSINSVYRIHTTNMSTKIDALLDGQVTTFQRNREILGLSPEEMAEIETRIRWNGANLFLTRRRRFEAIKMSLKNFHAKVPARAKIRQVVKLMLPYFALEATGNRIRRSSDEWKGLDAKDLMAEQAKSGKIYQASQK